MTEQTTQPEQAQQYTRQPKAKASTNFLASIFEFISDVINSAERSFLDLLSALVPYAVPTIPAYLTFYHVTNEMQFPAWVAWTAAFTTEVLGITSVSTAIRFYRHNAIYKDAKNKAPFTLAIAVYVFYIVIVLSVNVLLEINTGTRSGAVIWAIGLFSLLSLPSGVLISIRSQYAEMLEEKREQKEARTAARYPRQLGRSFAKDFEGLTLAEDGQQPANFRKRKRAN